MSASLRRAMNRTLLRFTPPGVEVVYRWERSPELSPGTVRVTFAEPALPPQTFAGQHDRLLRSVAELRGRLVEQLSPLAVALVAGIALGALLGRWM